MITSHYYQYIKMCFCVLGLLIEQLSRGTYECMICYNVVKRETAVWNCSNCYHIYHLYCIKRWANSSKQNASDAGSGVSGWRCPACQNVTDVFPSAYLCFCGMPLFFITLQDVWTFLFAYRMLLSFVRVVGLTTQY